MKRLIAGFQLFHSQLRNCNSKSWVQYIPICHSHSFPLFIEPLLQELSALRDELEEAMKGCYDHSRAARLRSTALMTTSGILYVIYIYRYISMSQQSRGLLVFLV